MTFPDDPLDLLVVAPHPDDAEISVGGTILKSLAQGQRVGVLELTNGEPTPRGTLERRAAETAQSTQILGLTWRGQLSLPNRSLENTLEARRELASVFRQLQPKTILAPYWEDAHPDHVSASALCDAARFWSKLSKTDMPGTAFHPPRIYYYFSIHLRIHPPASFVVDITPHIDQKLAAVSCYVSQMIEGRSTEHPTGLDDIRDRARFWGWSIFKGYAEPLVSREDIEIKDLRSLL